MTNWVVVNGVLQGQAFSVNVNGLVTTSTDGEVLANNTLATAAVPVQQSPRLRFRSHVWNTTVTAVDNTDDFFIESVPASGATPSGLLKFGKSLNGGAATFPLTVTSAGALTTLSTVFSGADVWVPAASAVVFTARSYIAAPTTGQFTLSNSASSAGVGLDVATDSLFKVRTRAQTGYATVDALGYRINGGNGAVGGVDRIQKSVASILNAAATTVLTITVPNAAHSATILVSEVGSLGAGGAIGVNEASAANSYYITVTRTPGVSAVAAISAAFGAGAVAVAGAATVTSVITVAAVVGIVSVDQTFPVQVTISRSAGSSTNHTCQLVAEVINANATGVTIA